MRAAGDCKTAERTRPRAKRARSVLCNRAPHRHTNLTIDRSPAHPPIPVLMRHASLQSDGIGRPSQNRAERCASLRTLFEFVVWSCPRRR